MNPKPLTPGHIDDDILDAQTVIDTRGFAWATFSPAELEGADADHCRDAMLDAGWDYISGHSKGKP